VLCNLRALRVGCLDTCGAVVVNDLSIGALQAWKTNCVESGIPTFTAYAINYRFAICLNWEPAVYLGGWSLVDNHSVCTFLALESTRIGVTLSAAGVDITSTIQFTQSIGSREQVDSVTSKTFEVSGSFQSTFTRSATFWNVTTLSASCWYTVRRYFLILAFGANWGSWWCHSTSDTVYMHCQAI